MGLQLKGDSVAVSSISSFFSILLFFLFCYSFFSILLFFLFCCSSFFYFFIFSFFVIPFFSFVIFLFYNSSFFYFVIFLFFFFFSMFLFFLILSFFLLFFFFFFSREGRAKRFWEWSERRNPDSRVLLCASFLLAQVINLVSQLIVICLAFNQLPTYLLSIKAPLPSVPRWSLTLASASLHNPRLSGSASVPSSVCAAAPEPHKGP